ncbi:hypothetical protein MKW92_043119 [Papaver armeniacum]|nr:hypothetical protein MKW92_043119 [Papaver armeniacum]
MASASSSSRNQQVALCGPGYVRVLNTPNIRTEVSAAGLQSEAATTDEQIDASIVEEKRPPYVIVVHGPHKVGKSTLIRSLAYYYSTDSPKSSVYRKDPLTIISGEQRRIQFVECPNDINGMLDAAKYADAVVLLIDTYIGFEMETFEFVNILRVHGMPKVMGVLTSLDMCTNVERLSRRKKYLMNHFGTEICEGARVFSLSYVNNGMYPKHEILDLASFISVMEFHPLSWRAAQPYVLAERLEDVTPPETDNGCNRNIAVYGYLRGCDIKKGTKVHIAGVGDFRLIGVTSLGDPCPLKASLKRKRCLEDEERIENEGFEPGTYLRLEVEDVPYNMVVNYNPYHPILVGGVTPGEDIGCIQASLKRHTWHNKLLKSRNPVIVSIGWRRYEASPIYAMKVRSGRLQMLNFTPVDTQCLAMFQGPLASSNTGIVVVQSVPDDKASFRILATAVVVPFNQDGKIWWKCKRRGTPWEISGKTALIKDLFRSDDEVDGFKDAKLWTESGIHGKVIKAAGKHDGLARCKFKGEILMKDKVFRRAWQEIVPPPSSYQLMTAPKAFDLATYNELRQGNGPNEFLELEEIKEEDMEGWGELEIKEEDVEDQQTDDEKDPHMERRPSLEGVRTVKFSREEPSFNLQALYETLSLRYCDKEEQREFAKHPLYVISKEEEMFSKLKGRERKKNCLEDFKKSHYFLNVRGR